MQGWPSVDGPVPLTDACNFIYSGGGDVAVNP
jgi:hypothetical protein